jgi:hypothetical protein
MIHPLAILDKLRIPYQVTSNVRPNSPGYHSTGDAYDLVIEDKFYFSLAVILFDLFHPGGVGVSRSGCRHIHIDKRPNRIRFNEIHLNKSDCTKNFRTEKVSFFKETYFFLLVLSFFLAILIRRK